MDIEIRELKPQEEPLLKDFLYEAVFRLPNQPPYPREIIEEPAVRVYIEGWGRPGDICLVAHADGEIAGAVWTRLLTDDKKGFGYVDDETPELAISLFKQYRGHGLGTKLMQSAICRLTADGYRKVSLSVTKDNPACRLYQRLGFQTIFKNDDDYLMVLNIAGNIASAYSADAPLADWRRTLTVNEYV